VGQHQRSGLERIRRRRLAQIKDAAQRGRQPTCPLGSVDALPRILLSFSWSGKCQARHSVPTASGRLLRRNRGCRNLMITDGRASKHAGSSWVHTAPAVKRQWPPRGMPNRHHWLGSLEESIVARIPMRNKWPDG
jgi:hypothetical protein